LVLAFSFTLVALPLAPAEVKGQGTGLFTFVQIAVRQGDAAVLQGPCGELGLIDTNRFRSAEVLAVLDSFGSRQLEWIVVSHYDADHLGGIVDVATAPGVSVETVYDRGGDANERDTQTYMEYFAWSPPVPPREIRCRSAMPSRCAKEINMPPSMSCPSAPMGRPQAAWRSRRRMTRAYA
jgi:glyoxylase-like metal-dependent hydrolase (beta-lactamase superfamily II)